MTKKNIVEDTKAAFSQNVDAKVNKGDKPQKIDGEKDTVNKKAHIRYDQELPDYSAATSKDTSKSSTVAKKIGAGEQKGSLNNMPMVDDLKGDAKVVNEEDAEDAELTEEEMKALEEHFETVMNALAEKMADFIPTSEKPVDMTEHVSVLFEGQDLSEEFKNKAKTVFEAAVHSKTMEIAGALLEAATEMVIENDLSLTESYEHKIDAAIPAIAEAWAEANAVGIQSRLKTEIAEDFIHSFIKLLNDHNIMLPEEKVDVVEAMADKVLELESALNEQIEANIQLREQINEESRTKVVEKLTEGLTTVEASKLRNLCEGIENTDDFEAAAKQLKESYFGKKSKVGNPLAGEEKVLTESEVNAEAKTIVEEANKPKAQTPVSSALSRFAPRR
jgi:hypothetical protein